MSSEDKQVLAQAAYDKALKYELDYGCCPQCVLAAVQETVGVIEDSVIKASHGLSGGGGLSGVGACGALTGGLIALSAKRGRDRDKHDKCPLKNNFNKGQELVDRFNIEFGGVTCAELQHQFTGKTYDMWNPEEYKAFDTARGEQCARATATVTRWVVEMM